MIQSLKSGWKGEREREGEGETCEESKEKRTWKADQSHVLFV